MTNPTLITTPFAENGDKNIIPESVGANPQNATMQAGFPPITQQKISEGGIPPERNDFNGILNLYGQHIVHLNKGLPYEFDQAFADAIGGYPLNSRIMLSNGDIVKSTTPNNTADPNVDMTGWVKSGDATQLSYSLLQNKITRSIYDKFYDAWSIKDFGAIGDGTLHPVQEWIDAGKFSGLAAIQVVFPFVTSTSDSIDWVALQGAIKALPLNNTDGGIMSPKGFANGGNIRIPRGRYYIDKKVSMQRGLRLTGESRESSQLISFIGADSVLQYTDSGRYIQDEIVIENLSIWQDGSVIATAGAAIDVVEGPATAQSLYLRVSNVIIEGTYHGIRHAAGVGGAVRDSNILKCVQHGIYITGVFSTTSMVFENTYCHLNGGFGYAVEKGAYIAFVGTASDSNVGGGYWLNQTKAYSFNGAGAESNTGPAIKLQSAGGGFINLFAISNNGGVIDTSTSDFISVVGGDWQGTGYAIRNTSGNTPVRIDGTVMRDDYATQRVDTTTNVCDLSKQATGKLIGGTKNQWAIGAIQQPESDATFAISGNADSATNYSFKVLNTFTAANATRNAALYAQAVTAPTATTYPLLIGAFVPNAVQGSGSTVTRSAGILVQEQTRGATANANMMIDAGQGTVPAGQWSIYNGSTKPNYFGGATQFNAGLGLFGTTAPTSKRSITGKLAPTTIAESNAVLDSIISALVAYGLVTDNRTA